MWFHSLFASWKSGLSRSRRPQPRPARRSTRLVLEQLEDRSLPSSYTAASVSALIADINAANAAGGANTISLTAPTTSPYALTAVNNTTNGATGLPVIAANDNLTIVGNGDTIERSGQPAYGGSLRLLETATEGSLTLQNLTLQGGLILGTTRFGSSGAAADPSSALLTGVAKGGAIYNEGTLVLDGVTVQGNMAGRLHGKVSGFIGIDAAGGGIFSSGGSVTLEGGTIVQNNGAFGFDSAGDHNPAGNAYGGGLYASGGTVTVTNATVDNNTAEAGNDITLSHGDGYAYGGGLYASPHGSLATITLTNATLDGNVATANNVNQAFGGGGAFGGGLYLYTVTATLTNCTVQGNSALNDTLNGHGEGGGIYIYSGTVYLDAATVAQVTGNTASDGAAFDNIVDPYILTPAAGQPPIVVHAASASPSPVTGTTTNLNVLGADAAGAASLTYTWAVTSTPTGAATPTFSNNGSNVSQNTTATFYRPGNYTFQVTVTDPSGLTAVSSVTVTVVPTVTSLSITPGNVTLADGKTQQFTATALDQFGQAMTSPPAFTWQVSNGGGTISSTGLYTAPKKGTGTFQVTVSADGLNAQANVTVD